MGMLLSKTREELAETTKAYNDKKPGSLVSEFKDRKRKDKAIHDYQQRHSMEGVKLCPSGVYLSTDVLVRIPG